MNQKSNEENFVVVVNGEGQYSIWNAEFEIPHGWEKKEKVGTQQECLEYIGEVWKDMRPKSVQSMCH